ncbi:hypothetical protein AGABI1DRAFT_95115 [Agaricus bisporus var. burnettii JB137-S8]|uniref:HAT C-terminal dimerisation domain-containing protein n=1 Tax=Agaricus bisporus var. burnettii (strain JB137-S8 / ATCC MYA-4627 / FGSC 10392) TaxID=597362 RepID=K5WX80_AGABU|nr:uncharacterized protein AGABI1DRAFT_95115 [Agaricus bisporus var. burnettii JB137-S8]EKM75177.1 hypothetical protein AGABI1DRAFT_95115 [Agaricus bisporus var. burnettii JB137-S8]
MPALSSHLPRIQHYSHHPRSRSQSPKPSPGGSRGGAAISLPPRHDPYPALRSRPSSRLGHDAAEKGRNVMVSGPSLLDPRYKVAYMRDAHWPSMWVDTAEDLVRETFETYYAPERDLVNEDMLPNPSQQTTSQPKNRFDRFKNYAAGSLLTASSSVDELTRYLRDGNLLTNRRNRLVGQTVRSLLCLGDWISAGIIMNKDIVRAVSGLPDIEGDDEVEMEAGWDRILK